MQGAEDRQGHSETQIAQGYNLVQAAGPCNIVLPSPQCNQEKQKAGAAHRNHRARDLKKCGEKGWVHVDAKRKSRALSWMHVFPGKYSFKLYNEEYARIFSWTGARQSG
jgi:hypothetical protein